MISKFNIAKALRDQAQSISDREGYELVTNGEIFQPGPDQTYIEEAVVFGVDNSIGISDCSSDIQVGFYQLKIFTPKTQTKWNGLKIADKYQEFFPKGLELSHRAQMLRIKNTTLGPIMFDDTHNIHILTIEYSVIG